MSYNKSVHACNAVYSILRYSPRDLEPTIQLLECGESLENINWFLKALPGLAPLYQGNRMFFGDVLRYHCGMGNLGFSDGFNYCASRGEPADAYIMLNEDMFFGPHCVEELILGLRDNIGLACCNLTNGGLFDRRNPKLTDVEDFASANRAHYPHTEVKGANPPWIVTRKLWETLSQHDVWEDCCLPLNRYPGAMDAAIDPYRVGWYADWDFFNRVRSLGLNTVVVESAHCYHYSNSSGSEKDERYPGWRQIPIINYGVKYGVFILVENMGLKELPVIKKPQYPWWPLRELPR